MIVLLLLLISSAHADMLLDYMQYNWNSPPISSSSSCSCPSSEPSFEEDYGNTDSHEAEHYSWDMYPIDPYESTEIIIDPYESSEYEY